MQKWKTLAYATAALLVLSTVAVLADSTGEVKDWWTSMKEHHETIHGDDFESHHQAMHGDDWREHVADCHEDTELEDMHEDGHMGTEIGSMMGTQI